MEFRLSFWLNICGRESFFPDGTAKKIRILEQLSIATFGGREIVRWLLALARNPAGKFCHCNGAFRLGLDYARAGFSL